MSHLLVRTQFYIPSSSTRRRRIYTILIMITPAVLGVADDLEKGLPRRTHSHSPEEGLFPLRKTLVIVTALVPLYLRLLDLDSLTTFSSFRLRIGS